MAAVNQLQFIRKGVNKALVDIDESTVYNEEFMGDDKITASFTLSYKIDVQISDYIFYDGRKYKIGFDLPPKVVKNDQGDWVYDITFYGPLYDLYNKKITDEGAQTFPYTGTPVELMTLLLDSVRMMDNTWLIGDVELITEPQTLSFDGTSCRVALTMIAEAFELEYKVIYNTDGTKSINLRADVGITLDNYTFKYGMNNGLYEIGRAPASNGFSTVWIGQGGTTNIPADYRGGTTGGRLSFEGNPVTVQPSFDQFGEREDTITFDDIFPKRTGVITTATKVDDTHYAVTDPYIDFDLNAQVILGSSKIVFKTGALGNEEFVITAFDNATKKITYQSFTEDSGYVLPSDTAYAQPGDSYTLVNINMPQSYVTDAENQLAAATIDHAQKNGSPKFLYSLVIDEHFIRVIGYENKLRAGDRLPVQDDDYAINAAIRMQTLSWPLVNPAAISATLSDDVQYSFTEKIIKAVLKTKSTATTNSDAIKLAAARAASANLAAQNAQKQADDAVASAAAANAELANIASDNIVTAGEKSDVLKDYMAIQAEKPVIDAQADVYSISHVDYDSKYTDLQFYIVPILADMTVDTAIDGPTFRARFNDYYTAKINLTKAISDKAKQLADQAASDAAGANSAAAAAALLANAAQAAADQAAIDAEAANTQLANIASDNVITPDEKQDVLKDWLIIQGEKPTIDAQADTYVLSHASYDTNYSNLSTYLAPILTDMTVNSAIDGPTFRAMFQNYYNAKVSLLKDISDKAKQIADQAAATAVAAQLFAAQVQDDVENSAAYSMFQKTNISDLSVLSAAFIAGNPFSGTVGGVNGTAFNPTDVVFWAGADFNNKDTAVFRVLLNGKVYMTGATITGEFISTSGKIGNYTIDEYGLINTDDTAARILQKVTYPDNNIVSAYIGTAVDFDSAPNNSPWLLDIINHRKATNVNNRGIRVSVTNGTWHPPLDNKSTGNSAIEAQGDVFIADGNFYFSNGVFYADMVKGMWLYNVMDEFNTAAFHSGQIRGHVTNGKCFLVIHNG